MTFVVPIRMDWWAFIRFFCRVVNVLRRLARCTHDPVHAETMDAPGAGHRARGRRACSAPVSRSAPGATTAPDRRPRRAAPLSATHDLDAYVDPHRPNTSAAVPGRLAGAGPSSAWPTSSSPGSPTTRRTTRSPRPRCAARCTVRPTGNAAALTGLGALAAARHDFRGALGLRPPGGRRRRLLRRRVRRADRRVRRTRAATPRPPTPSSGCSTCAPTPARSPAPRTCSSCAATCPAPSS